MKLTIKEPNFAPYQKAILDCPKRFTITEASTKVGKTFSHLYWLFKEAHKQPQPKEGAQYWWVAPTFSMAEIAFTRIYNKIAKTGLYKINLADLTIKTPTGSIIAFKSADNPDSLYGEDVYCAVFDEFTRAKPQAWHALRSTLTYTNGKCKLIGNFTGIANWGHQLAEKAKDPNSEYAYFKVTAYDAVAAGILKAEEIEQARKDLPAQVFAALYLAEAMEETDQLIKNNKILDLFTNTFVEAGTERVVSADVALLNDKCVFFCRQGLKFIDYEVHIKPKSDELPGLLIAFADKTKTPRSNIVYDADGLGLYLKDFLDGGLRFNGNHAAGSPEYANLRARLYYLLSKLINENKMFFECALPEQYRAELIAELQAIKAKEVKGKYGILDKQGIKEIIGRSPDFSDCLMMSLIFWIIRKY